MFINSIADLQAAISGAPTEGVDFDTRFAPTVRKVEREYVSPLFPIGVLLRLLEDSPTPALSREEIYLKGLILEAIAHLATWKFSFTAAVVQTGSGLQTFRNDTFVDSAKYAKQDYRDQHENDGLTALESSLHYAVINKAHIEGFEETPEYEAATARLFNFSRDYNLVKSWITTKTFYVIEPNIELIERESVVPMLGETFYETLRTAQYEGTLSAKKRTLLHLLRGGIAQYAIKLGIEMNLVTLNGHQVIVKEMKNSDDKETHTMPRKDLYEVAMASLEAYSLRYFAQAKAFLLQNATDLNWTDPNATLTAWVPPTETTQKGVKTL